MSAFACTYVNDTKSKKEGIVLAAGRQMDMKPLATTYFLDLKTEKWSQLGNLSRPTTWAGERLAVMEVKSKTKAV